MINMDLVMHSKSHEIIFYVMPLTRYSIMKIQDHGNQHPGCEIYLPSDLPALSEGSVTYHRQIAESFRHIVLLAIAKRDRPPLHCKTTSKLQTTGK